MSNNIFTSDYIRRRIVDDTFFKLYPYFKTSPFGYLHGDGEADRHFKFRDTSHIVTIASETSKNFVDVLHKNKNAFTLNNRFLFYHDQINNTKPSTVCDIYGNSIKKYLEMYYPNFKISVFNKFHVFDGDVLCDIKLDIEEKNKDAPMEIPSNFEHHRVPNEHNKLDTD